MENNDQEIGTTRTNYSPRTPTKQPLPPFHLQRRCCLGSVAQQPWSGTRCRNGRRGLQRPNAQQIMRILLRPTGTRAYLPSTRHTPQTPKMVRTNEQVLSLCSLLVQHKQEGKTGLLLQPVCQYPLPPPASLFSKGELQLSRKEGPNGQDRPWAAGDWTRPQQVSIPHAHLPQYLPCRQAQ